MYDSSITRRSLLAYAMGAGLLRQPAYAFATEFWNVKDPSTWTDDEIRQLLAESPWSKHITIKVEDGSEDGLPRNSTGRRDRNGPGQGGQAGAQVRTWPEDFPIFMSHQVSGTVRWESAQPVRDATDSPLPRQFAHHYAISLTGFNLGASVSVYPDGEGPSTFTKSFLERIRAATSLSSKGDAAPATIVREAGSAVLLGFSKRSIKLSLGDEHVEFATKVDRLSIKAKFGLKEMLYHGGLAI
jgi:hypothetical protein